MSHRHIIHCATCVLLLGAAGCGTQIQPTEPTESAEQKAQNIGDRYVRGILGTGNNAQGTVNVAAIQKAIQMYRVEKGTNPPTLSALHQAGYLPQQPTAPRGQRFDYNASSGTVKLVSQ